jgi:hypothetical protein
LKGNFQADFSRFFVDFGTTLGANIDPESEKKGTNNKTDFSSTLDGRRSAIEPWTWSAEAPLGASQHVPDKSKKQ